MVDRWEVREEAEEEEEGVKMMERVVVVTGEFQVQVPEEGILERGYLFL